MNWIFEILNSPILWGIVGIGLGAYLQHFFIIAKSKDERKRQFDKETHEKMLGFLKPDGFVFYIKQRDVMGGYLNHIHRTMDEFHEFCSNPQNFYLDKELRKLQLELDEAVESFNHILAINSIPSKNADYSKPFQSQSNDYEGKAKEFKEQQETISVLQDLIYQKAESLIIAAKKKL